jgi:uncharacterized protein YcbK (DUF882 family)
MHAQRRQLLLGAAAGLAGMTGVGRAAALPPPRTCALSLFHIHTREALSIDYRVDGIVIESAVHSLGHLLRDFRSGQTHAIDLDLLDKLALLYDRFGQRGRYEIISAYRSPRTNAALRRATTGVAENSLHMEGRAIDVRLVGTPTTKLRDAALELGSGGVGYYSQSNFVHLDTGPARSW